MFSRLPVLNRWSARFLLLLCVFVATTGVSAAAQAVLENRLAGHPSPYLSMHGADPVAWQPWGDDVFVRAREEGKLVFVSSGYFSCHWCHVMQRESYRNADIAAFINRHFIPVKIDRELQPALDAFLIDFVERTRGQAGWPLNVFLTPEGHPLFGFTYLPPGAFSELMENLQARWRKDGDGLAELAREAGTQRQKQNYKIVKITPQQLDKSLVQQALQIGDELQGGFGQQNKFPMAPQLLALLDVQARSPDAGLGEFLALTLDQMARGGLRDHLNGGFFRYSTTPDWQVPHFEKMLYDNALLILVYLRAADVLGEPAYRDIARETLDFVVRELPAENGTYVSSLSAIDEQGVEGGYYLWDLETIEKVLDSTEMKLARRYYRLDHPPALEHGYHLVPVTGPDELATETGQTRKQVESALRLIRAKLVAARSRRSVPVDTKVLSGWNGLMLEALVAGAQSLQDAEPYAVAANRLRESLLNEFWDGTRLLRARDNGNVLGDASLEDYAYVAGGLHAWDRAFGEKNSGRTTAGIVAQGWQRFYRNPGWQLGEAMIIPAGNQEPALADGPMPSPAAHLIAISESIADEPAKRPLNRNVRQALETATGTISRSPFWYASYVRLYHH